MEKKNNEKNKNDEVKSANNWATTARPRSKKKKKPLTRPPLDAAQMLFGQSEWDFSTPCCFFFFSFLQDFDKRSDLFQEIRIGRDESLEVQTRPTF